MKKFLTYLTIMICLFGLVGCSSEIDKQDKKDVIGVVDKETVETMVARFNEVVVETSGLGYAQEETLSTDNGLYTYDIADGIFLVVLPLDVQKTKEEDIVNSMRIYVKNGYENDPQVEAYVRMLITANNDEITNEEANALIEEAIEKSSEKLTSNNGKGISVGFIKAEDHVEYQVIRNYE